MTRISRIKRHLKRKLILLIVSVYELIWEYAYFSYKIMEESINDGCCPMQRAHNLELGALDSVPHFMAGTL